VASLLAAGVFALSLIALVAIPALWLAGGSDASAGSLDGLALRASAAAVDGRELEGLAARSARGTPAAIRTRSARLADLPTPPDRGRPELLRISGLGVEAAVRPVGVAGGLVEVPRDADVVGWYRHGPAPGEPGSTVLVGHVDLDGRRGVFFRLRELEPGAVVTVRLERGAPRSFRVVARRSYPKGKLPPFVFAEAGRPVLTLITCGGSFDDALGAYEENVVVVATLLRPGREAGDR
jgi:Sortase domain